MGEAKPLNTSRLGPARPTGLSRDQEILHGKGTANMRKRKTQGPELWKLPAEGLGIRAEWCLILVMDLLRLLLVQIPRQQAEA